MIQEKIAAPLVITSHANADFDALAAMVAASRLYPGAVLVFPGSQEKNLRNFYIQSAMYMFNFRNVKEIDLSTVRTLVVVDTRQIPRLSHVSEALENDQLEIHAYDHHPDTDNDVNQAAGIVNNWGSTATILTHELIKHDIDITPDEATIIALGIYEDTGSFGFNSTTPEDLHAAAWLLQQGMDVTVVSDLITRDLSAQQISYLNALISAAQTHEIKGIPVVVTEISTEYYVSDFAMLVHKLRDMENIDVLFAIARMDDRVHIVARSRSKDVDVGQICSSFGGGGHASAASASVKKRTPSQIRDELFALLYTHIRPDRSVSELMSSPAVVIEKDMTIAEGNEIMTRYGLKAAPIVDMESGMFVGVLEHQTADKAMGHGLGGTPATEYMMRAPQTITLDGGLYQAVEIILGNSQRLLPVMDNDAVVGVITRTDLINILIEEPARIPENLLPERTRERNIRVMLREKLTEEIFHILKEAGMLADEMDVSIYAVGGFIRDILLDKPNGDLDLVVEGDGIAFAKQFGKRIGGRVRSHRKFQTAVIVLPDGKHIDVATARLEYYEYPAALPTVELSSIKMDLFRRDFTINALAVQLNPSQFGRLVDFFGAQRDIKEKVIRVLHSLSFVEDPTRILRAIRFAQRYNFRVGGQTLKLIKNALKLKMIERLSGSRVFHELELIFEEENAVNCLRSMRDLKVLKTIHPLLTISPTQEALLEELMKVLEWHRMLYTDQPPRRWMLFLLALANGASSKQLDSLMERLYLTRRQSSDLRTLRSQLNDVIYKFKMWRHNNGPVSEMVFILDELPIEGVLFFMTKYNTEDTRKSLSNYLTQLKHQALEVSGNDLKKMGLPSGPAFGAVLKKLRAAMLDGYANCRADQLELARKLVKNPEYRGLSDNYPGDP